MAEKLKAPTGVWIKQSVPSASGILCGSTTINCGALNIGCGGGFLAVKLSAPSGVWTKIDAPT